MPTPTSLVVRDSTALNSVDTNGWVADVTFSGMAVGGTVDATKTLLLNRTRPGFDATGTATTLSDTIRATVALRKPAPNQATFVTTASGSDAVVSVALDKRVYPGETITAASVAAGFYTASSVASLAVASIASITNSSTWAYEPPVCGWAQPQYMSAVGSTFHVEFFAFSKFARSGKMVPCVEFRVETLAGVDQGISVKSTTMTQSTRLLASGCRVYSYAADIPLAALAQGTSYKVRALVYPFVGTAALDTDAFDAPGTSARLSSLQFLCDKGGTYGNVVAFVRAGSTGGTVGLNTNLAGARATPFPTRATAATAIKAANNAKASPDTHNDCGGGTIYLMDGAGGAAADYNGFNEAAYSTATTGAVTYTTIAVDPAAVGAVRFVSSPASGSSKNVGWGTRFLGVSGKLFTFATVAVVGNANDNILIDSGGSTSNNIPLWMDYTYFDYGLIAAGNAGQCAFAKYGLTYLTNSTQINASTHSFTPVGATRTQYALIAGNTISGLANTSSVTIYPQVCVGNLFTNGCITSDAATTLDSNDGGIDAFNAYLKQTSARSFGLSGNFTRGYVRVQNLVEVIANTTNAAADIDSGDNGVANIYNYISFYESAIGERSNRLYTSSGITPSFRKTGVHRFCIFENTNAKSDVFWVSNLGNPDGSDRTGNWEFRFGVDCLGNFTRNGDAAGAHTPSASAWWSEAGVGIAVGAVGATSPFVNDQGTIRNGVTFSSATGGGDYHLTGASNPLYGLVPAGAAALPFDADGVARRNDGTGAAGYYERTDLVAFAFRRSGFVGGGVRVGL